MEHPIAISTHEPSKQRPPQYDEDQTSKTQLERVCKQRAKSTTSQDPGFKCAADGSFPPMVIFSSESVALSGFRPALMNEDQTSCIPEGLNQSKQITLLQMPKARNDDGNGEV